MFVARVKDSGEGSSCDIGSHRGVISKWQVNKVMHLLLLDHALFGTADSCMKLPLTFVACRWKFYPEIIIAAKKGRCIQNFNFQVDVVIEKAISL